MATQAPRWQFANYLLRTTSFRLPSSSTQSNRLCNLQDLPSRANANQPFFFS
jgi:hypothetical protein